MVLGTINGILSPVCKMCIRDRDLLNKRFIVFELDVVKDNPVLFPVVTIIIMETFINKMRRLQGIRKICLLYTSGNGQPCRHKKLWDTPAAANERHQRDRVAPSQMPDLPHVGY